MVGAASQSSCVRRRLSRSPEAAAGIPFLTLPRTPSTPGSRVSTVKVNCRCSARVHAGGSRGTASRHTGASLVDDGLSVPVLAEVSPGSRPRHPQTLPEAQSGTQGCPRALRAPKLSLALADPRVRRLDPGRPGLRPEDSLRLSPGWTSPDPSCFCGGFLVCVGGELPGFLRKGGG